MLTVVLGLAGALIYGAADFLGGLASRRISALRVTAIGALSGVVLLVLGTFVIPGRWSFEAVLWGGISGVTGAAAIALLYACLAIGPMSILSPLTAVTSAIVPLTWGLFTGSTLGFIAYPAFAIALVAVVLVGLVPEQGAVRPTLRGMLMALASGTLIGAFYILIDLTPNDSGLVPLVVNRTVNGTIMVGVIVIVAFIAAQRHVRAVDAPLAVLDGTHGAPLAVVGDAGVSGAEVSGAGVSGAEATGAEVLGAGPSSTAASVSATSDTAAARPTVLAAAAGALRGGWRAGFWLAVGCGVLDATANIIVLVGLRLGDLEIVSVLTALYPAGTILLAAVVLRERIGRLQWVGLALALTASAMLAAA